MYLFRLSWMTHLSSLATAGVSSKYKKTPSTACWSQCTWVKVIPVIGVIGKSCNWCGHSCHRHIVNVRPYDPHHCHWVALQLGWPWLPSSLGKATIILLVSDHMVHMVIVIRLGCNWGGYDCHHCWAKSSSYHWCRTVWSASLSSLS